MKKTLIILLTVLLALSSSICFAEGAETSKTISFFGYTFGDTFGNIRSTKKMSSLDFKYGNYNARVVGDALADMAERDLPEGNAIPSSFFARLSGTGRVAGYDAGVKLWFVYSVQDGAVLSGETDAIFYAGEYEFHSWDDIVSIHADLKGKLETLYGTPFYAGGDLNAAMGEMPLREGVVGSYNDDNAKFKPEYTVWKSSANGACAVMAFWRDSNVNEYKLKLTYISACADEHFGQMAEMGMFGGDFGTAVETGMEGL